MSPRSSGAITVLLVTITVAMAAAPAAAQQAYRGPVLLTLPASTRALALGNAFPVGTTDSDHAFYNAAFSDRLRGASAAVHFFGRGSVFAASAGTEWWHGGLAVGVRALDYGLGNVEAALPTGEAALMQEGSLSAERVATLSYGRSVRGVRLGASGHLVQQRTVDQSRISFAGDVAAAVVVGPVSTGLAVRNIGTGSVLAGGDIDAPVMVTLSAGTGSRPVGPLDVMPAASLTYEFDGDVVAGGGIEIGYWPVQGRTFLLRLGARYGEPGTWATAGAGFVGYRLIVDYAVVPFDDGDVSHRIGIRWQ
ncbi:hypothetical protein BH23GEM10_BH23GEM10_12530 [soil metagenome]